jgi:O-antigen ligase
MIRWFYKYGFVLLLLNTILYSINETKDTVAPIVFYFLMGGGLFLLVINPAQIKDVIFHKSFLFLFLINLINLIYFLFFEDEFNQKSLQFLMARFVQFSLISLSIYHNYDYYKKKFPSLITKAISFTIILGLFYNPYLFSESRYNGIIWNPNMLASLSVLAFSFLLMKNEKKTNLDVFLLILLFIVSIATGSRLALLGIAFAFIYKFGFSFRNTLYALMGLILLIILSTTDLDTSFNRFYSQDILNDRTEQFNFAIENINKKLWFGYGLSEYSGNPEEIEIPEEYQGFFMASHNGYLSLFLQYGLLFGSFILLIILRKSLGLLFYYIKKEQKDSIFLFVIFLTLISALFETLVTGINEFHTILFWFSLSYLSYSRFIEDYES